MEKIDWTMQVVRLVVWWVLSVLVNLIIRCALEIFGITDGWMMELPHSAGSTISTIGVILVILSPWHASTLHKEEQGE